MEKETSLILNWFKIDEMKSNDDKCHLMVCKKNNDDKCHLMVCKKNNVSVTLGNETIKESNSVELLGIKINAHLNMNEHVTNICKEANQKLHALARISKYLREDKLKFLMKTFIQPQFNYFFFFFLHFFLRYQTSQRG